MAKVINITELKILNMEILPVEQCIRVRYQIYDEFGTAYGSEKVETYWITLPANAGASDNQLPANFVTLVTTLYTSALDALKTKHL
jgi:hypothetical protein